jgi:hypothetical protein
MADDIKRDSDKNLSDEDRLRKELRRDPEFEMPDPDQVERDIKDAEKVYGEDEKKKTA